MQGRHKLVMNIFLHQYSISTYTCLLKCQNQNLYKIIFLIFVKFVYLATASESGANNSIDGLFQIGTIENNEWRIATQLHLNFFYRAGTVGQYYFTHCRRSGEADLFYCRMFA